MVMILQSRGYEDEALVVTSTHISDIDHIAERMLQYTCPLFKILYEPCGSSAAHEAIATQDIQSSLQNLAKDVPPTAGRKTPTILCPVMGASV